MCIAAVDETRWAFRSIEGSLMRLRDQASRVGDTHQRIIHRYTPFFWHLLRRQRASALLPGIRLEGHALFTTVLIVHVPKVPATGLLVHGDLQMKQMETV